MSKPELSLLSTRRFGPFFWVQFLGAFNDNVFKGALSIMVLSSEFTLLGLSSGSLATLAAGIFISPFFLFSGLAGLIAEKFDKTGVARIIKALEVCFMLLAAVGLFVGSSGILFLVLFLMGLHSTLFGPIKYSILPDILDDNELVGGNAIIEAGTFLAILLGTIIGGTLGDSSPTILSLVLITTALLGLMFSAWMPRSTPASPELKLNLRVLDQTWDLLQYAAKSRGIFLSILGISWFWLVGGVYLAELPTLVREVFQANTSVVTLLLTTFSLGIGAGSILCNRILKGQISARYVPLASLLITVFSFDLFLSCYSFTNPGADLLTVREFLSYFTAWRVIFDLLGLSLAGGLFIVPLYTIIQSESSKTERSRTIAANNVVNAGFMVMGAVSTSLMLALGFSIGQTFLVIALLSALVTVYVCGLLPDAVVQSYIRWALSFFYRVEVRGIENYSAAGDRVLIIANHTSFLDAVLLAAFLPDKLTFAVSTRIASRWWMKPILGLFDALPIDPTNPMATKTLINLLKANKRCMIFPEGRITVTGALMKVYEGPAMIAHTADAMVLPIRIEGAQYTPFSRLRGKVKLRAFPKIKLTILKPRKITTASNLKGRATRNAIGAKLYNIMTEMLFEGTDFRTTLFDSLLNAARTHGGNHTVLEDLEYKPITYAQLITRSIVLGRKLSKFTKHAELVGVLLPNAVSSVSTFFALQSIGRVPAMLNYSVGDSGISGAVKAAQIKTVITSRRFIELGKLESLITAAESQGAQVLALEDIATDIGAGSKLLGAIFGLCPNLYYHKISSSTRLASNRNPENTAVVLFTSGSEGSPKGVALSHINLESNRTQLTAKIDFSPTDKVFNALPIFHSFGLTGGTLLPLLSGLKTFLYPSPLHYRVVPELIYGTDSTLVFGTDTFLSGYAKHAHPYDFYSVRYVFAGAERLKPETKKIYSERFGVRVFEGYGATETSPALAMNTPMQNKEGSVGRFLPGIEHRLERIDGIADGGRLFVRGPNVMLGYYKVDKPGVLEPLSDDWYDTGDIVALDEDGYIFIKGRAKRFAKIAGEMVSLSAVESVISSAWPDELHAVVSLEDPRKGEKLILVTASKQITRENLIQAVRASGLSEIAIPKGIVTVGEVPILGTGKLNYAEIKNIALSSASTDEVESRSDSSETSL